MHGQTNIKIFCRVQRKEILWKRAWGPTYIMRPISDVVYCEFYNAVRLLNCMGSMTG